MYFSKFYVRTKKRVALRRRRFRIEKFSLGDIIGLYYRTFLANNYFEGSCIALRKYNLPEFTFSLVNIIMGISIEIKLAFYYNRCFFFRVNDYKRKAFFYKRSKLYYFFEQGIKSIT